MGAAARTGARGAATAAATIMAAPRSQRRPANHGTWKRASALIPQGVEIGGDIARIMIVQPHIRHGVTGHDALRRHEPGDEVVGRVGQNAGDDGAVPDIVERRPDPARSA